MALVMTFTGWSPSAVAVDDDLAAEDQAADEANGEDGDEVGQDDMQAQAHTDGETMDQQATDAKCSDDNTDCAPGDGDDPIASDKVKPM